MRRMMDCIANAMTRWLRLAMLALAAAGIVSACGGGSSDDNVVCTTEARASVMLTVVDAANASLSNVAVAYSVNGGALQLQSCEPNGMCAVGFEQVGIFLITASKLGYATSQGTVTVLRDACHVITERLTLVLQRS